jgi:prolyl-tRNA synthetase
MWCGDADCEDRVKEETGATIRCIPFEQEDLGTKKCICCDKEADKMVYFARAY